MIRIALAVAATVALPAIAHAQAYSCSVPATIPRPHPDLPTTSEPQRVLPIGGYTFAITWSPEYCHGHAREPGAQLECGSANRFGFTLHGLWPDGVGKAWPQYCKATTLLPAPVIRAHLCANPSVQLTQHEWAKHGTCTTDTPAAFLARSRAIYGALRYPDMDALSRRRDLTVGSFASAFAAANPGMSADMMRIDVNRSGWLAEIWLCLDKQYHYRRCPAFEAGAPATARLKIWRRER